MKHITEICLLTLLVFFVGLLTGTNVPREPVIRVVTVTNTANFYLGGESAMWRLGDTTNMWVIATYSSNATKRFK